MNAPCLLLRRPLFRAHLLAHFANQWRPGVMLPYALERKYPKAGTQLVDRPGEMFGYSEAPLNRDTGCIFFVVSHTSERLTTSQKNIDILMELFDVVFHTIRFIE